MDIPGNQPLACIVDPFPYPWPQPTYIPPVLVPVQPYVITTAPHYHFTTGLSDTDIDRIARRVAEILREPKP